MSWLDELRLRDIDDESIIEATCLSCGHTWKQTPYSCCSRSITAT